MQPQAITKGVRRRQPSVIKRGLQRLWGQRIWLVVAPVRFYQRFISRYTPPTCRFSPSCSQYAIEAVLQHGLIKGGIAGIWRILRCNPWGKGGEDKPEDFAFFWQPQHIPNDPEQSKSLYSFGEEASEED